MNKEQLKLLLDDISSVKPEDVTNNSELSLNILDEISGVLYTKIGSGQGINVSDEYALFSVLSDFFNYIDGSVKPEDFIKNKNKSLNFIKNSKGSSVNNIGKFIILINIYNIFILFKTLFEIIKSGKPLNIIDKFKQNFKLPNNIKNPITKQLPNAFKTAISFVNSKFTIGQYIVEAKKRLSMINRESFINGLVYYGLVIVLIKILSIFKNIFNFFK